MRDIHSEITDKIIAALEKGVRPWSKSWTGTDGFVLPISAASGKPYHGANVIVLWLTAEEMGYKSPYWMTYKQSKAEGGQVRKGEKATQIMLVKRFSKTDDAGEERSFSVGRSFSVFNADQIDGLPAKYLPKIIETPVANTNGTIEAAETFFAKLDMDVRHGGAKAFYSPSKDFVQMPHLCDFTSSEAYYGTKAHEATHWTGSKKRLDRNLDGRFGTGGNSMEELVAELGAAFVMAALGLSNEPREDHASYIQNWLKVLKEDKRAIFTAASAADRAVEFMTGKQSDSKVVVTTDDEDELEMAA